MSWYQNTFYHPVMCYGCDSMRKISTSEWMAKKSDPGGWRCPHCRAEGTKLAEIPVPEERDRTYQAEFMLRSIKNDRRHRG